MDGDIYSRGLNSRVYLALDFLQHAGHIHIAPLRRSDFWWNFTISLCYMMGSSIVKELYLKSMYETALSIYTSAIFFISWL